MPVITLSPFQRTLQRTQDWMNDLTQRLHVEDEQRAYHALRAVLHTLRDRLTVEESTDLAAQLPLLVRGLYYENWNPSKTPMKERSREQFLTTIAEAIPEADLDPQRAAQAVFELLASRVTAGEISDVKAMLPDDIRSLWPE